ncbi:envelope-like protein, partial [Trifolium medium]|nr:envelope-like protein [Trifolium medium]
LKRKAPPSSDSEYDEETDDPDIEDSEEDMRQDVRHNVINIGISGRKKIGGKKIPQNIPDAPVDNVSFHSLKFAHRWNFVYHRRLALERKLGKVAAEDENVIRLIEKAGLKRTVQGIGD